MSQTTIWGKWPLGRNRITLIISWNRLKLQQIGSETGISVKIIRNILRNKTKNPLKLQFASNAVSRLSQA